MSELVRIKHLGCEILIKPCASGVKSRGKSPIPFTAKPEACELIKRLSESGELLEAQKVILWDLIKRENKSHSPRDLKIEVKYPRMPALGLYRVSFASMPGGYYFYALSSNPASREHSIKHPKPLDQTLSDVIELAKKDAFAIAAKSLYPIEVKQWTS